MNRWEDWYDQGKRDVEKAQLDLEHGYYEWACFKALQAAEKVIKALGMKVGVILWGHPLYELTDLLSARLEIPLEIKDKARLLDLFYIPPRDPNGFAAGKPADYFFENQAREAIDGADSIIRFCESHMAG